ncbi:GAF domain-containing protein [Streptomyces ortus]|uniref:GAF domain-containing protein n=1 Tax=Streptomyces ortus TaxID=2867268 RepID=A0ABT3UWW2_9ACTN|nr:hypothetical protein [Streptomyces ortus]MCX4231828.1 hypothetical protein [Streptomyces ortus]
MFTVSGLIGRRKIKPWGVAVLSAISVGLPTIPAFAEKTFGPYYIATCVFCAFAASFFTLHTSQTKVEAERSEVLEAALEPLSSLMGKILVDPEIYDEKHSTILKKLVETAGELAHADVASGLYWLSPDNSELQLSFTNEKATQRHFEEKFSRGGEKGSFLVEMALSSSGRSVPDIRKDPDRDRIYMADDCRSAVFIPVKVGTTQRGLLVVQAKKPKYIPGSFRDDKRFKTVVHLIGVVSEIRKPSTDGRPVVPGQNKSSVDDPEGAPS